jgi:hypothetical protein
MKKIDLGQTISILANLGVIAGIVFLAFELRQNNAQLEIISRDQTVSRRFEAVDLVLANPYLIDLLRKNDADLTQQERDRLTALGLRVLLNFEEQYRDVTLGRFDRDEAIKGQRAVYHRDWLNYGMPIAWDLYRERASPEFAEWMQEYIIPK